MLGDVRMNVLQPLSQSFQMLQPGMPLRFKVVGDIYFGPVSLRNRHEIFPRLNLGRTIASKLEGYWCWDEHGRLVRFPEKQDHAVFDANHPCLVVEVDLRRSFPEVYALYSMLTNPSLHLLQPTALVVL